MAALRGQFSAKVKIVDEKQKMPLANVPTVTNASLFTEATWTLPIRLCDAVVTKNCL